MTTFALIHGAGDVGWYWHLVERELRSSGHDTVAPDLPGGPSGLAEYTSTVVDAIGLRSEVVVVGQSFAGFVAPLVVDRIGASALVFVAGMVPSPGEPPSAWWANTGYPGPADADDLFYHDVPDELAALARSQEGAESTASFDEPWPLPALPAVPTSYVLCRQDRFFPASFIRRMVADRLDIVPDELDAGHCVALSRPTELAAVLLQVASGHGNVQRGRRDQGQA